jgi:hypothetical protein
MTSTSLRGLALSAALTLATGCLAVAPPAAAAVTYAYAGTVSGGLDDTGVFGVAGQTLQGLGLTFTASIVRRDAPGASHLSDATSTEIVGYGESSPLHASFAINGRVFSFDTTSSSQYQIDDPDGCGPGCEFEQFAHIGGMSADVLDPATGVTHVFRYGFTLTGLDQDLNLLPSPDYHTLPSLQQGQGVYLYGIAVFEDYLLGPDGQRSAYNHGEAHFTPASMTVTNTPDPVAGVPEPASWALIVLGFAATGAVLRTRRQRGQVVRPSSRAG